MTMSHMRWLAPVIALAGFASDSAEPAHPKPLALDEHSQTACSEWLKQNGMDPQSYVVSEFSNHDLVLLGETHEIKENCEFVANLIAPLYDAGVHTLCSEFLRSRFNERLAKLVLAADYDEPAVVDMFRQGAWPVWGYKEYMDIVRAVWEANQNRPADAKPFRIIGIDSDWKQIEISKAKSDLAKFNIVSDREKHMHEVVEREVFDKNEKALVHIGFAHTARHGERLAANLARKHGDRMFQICLHHKMRGRGGDPKLTEFIEEVVEESGRKAVGFDVAGTPFGNLRDENGLYFQMLGKGSTFQDFAEGYVLLKPAAALTSVTWQKGFIVSDTFEDAKYIAEQYHWVEKGTCQTPAELDVALANRLVTR